MLGPSVTLVSDGAAWSWLHRGDGSMHVVADLPYSLVGHGSLHVVADLPSHQPQAHWLLGWR